MINLKNINNQLTNGLSNNIIIVFIVFIGLLFLIPILLTQCSILGFSSEANEIGDAIGGTTAPIIGVFSALLVYLAFKSQLDANEKLNKANEKLLEINESMLKVNIFTVFKEKLEFILKNNNSINYKGEEISIQDFQLLIEKVNPNEFSKLKGIESTLIESLRLEDNIDMIVFFIEEVLNSELYNSDKKFLLFPFINFMSFEIPKIEIPTHEQKTFGKKVEYDKIVDIITHINENVKIFERKFSVHKKFVGIFPDKYL